MGSRACATLVAAAIALGVVFSVARSHAADQRQSAGYGRAAAASPDALEAAREESGALPAPHASLSTPAGTLRIVQPELVAATFGQPIRFELTVDDTPADGTLSVAIPARWSTRTVSGLTPSKTPRTMRSTDGVTLQTKAGAASLRVVGAEAGARMDFQVVDTGIPASTYKLPVTWSDASGSRSLGTLEVRFYAPARESPETRRQAAAREPAQRLNVTNDTAFESETFATAVPNDTQRVLVGANGGPGAYNAWLSTNGGTSFTELAVPASMDVRGTTTNQAGELCCDPFSMADDNGNIWYGGLALDGNPPSRITISRIAAGTSTFVSTVGLPERTGSGIQDKPMGAIDLATGSPHYGRLYVVWDEPGVAGVNVVITMCDTRVPVTGLDAARCDNADNWTLPVTIAAAGSYIYPEVAAGPDGKAYVIWWDYSATNAIRGSTCLASANCATVAGWSAASTIATLDATGGAPVPFACPTLAQPGGRVGPATAMDIDHSGGATDGTVYVTWSDLRTGSGTTRCDDSTPPATTQLTWDSFVATATNALPGGAGPSASVGTRLITGAEGGAAADDWFPSVAVDQSNGAAWADVYSTLLDSTRRTMQVFARPVGPGASIGALSQVSTVASNYSTTPCCGFDNDYGDYNGIEAAGGKVFVPWSDKSGTDGEAFINVFDESNPPGPPGPPGPPPPPPPANQRPFAAITGPSLVTAGPVTFSALGSLDTDGAIVRFRWDVDGNPANGFEVETGAIGKLTRMLAAGKRTVTVKVTDNRGGSDQASKTLTVRPIARVHMLRNGAVIKLRSAFRISLAGCSLCTGRITATTKGVKVGSAAFKLNAAGKVVVRVKVSQAAQKLLRKARRLRVTLKLTVANGAGGTGKAAGRVTLRR